MKRKILYKCLIPIPLLALLILCAFVFAPSDVPDAAVVAKNVRITPVRSGQVLKEGTAMALQCEMPPGTRSTSISWASSNPAVISISPSGVLRAKKRGDAEITLHIRFTRNHRKKVGERTFPLHVGTPVSSMALAAETDTIGRGESLAMFCKIAPADVSDKKVLWNSSNPSVATVSDEGLVTAIHSGETVISARATDGTGISASKGITVYAAGAKDTHFIAHRGLLTEAPENTISAFDLAGKAGFWGAECDIRESAPDEDGTTDLIISHDKTFARMTGDPRRVSEVTAEEATGLPVITGRNHETLEEHICTLSDFLTSCAAFGMAPVIEIKEPDMSDAAYRRMFWCLEAAHLADDAVFISFNSHALDRVRSTFDECRADLNLTADAYPECWLLYGEESGGTETAAYAITAGYNGIFLKPEAIDKEAADFCSRSGLGLAACTFSARDHRDLYEKLQSYNLQMATTNGKLFE